MLPDFDENGNLPEGEHLATVDQVVEKYNVHSWRTRGPITSALQVFLNEIRIYFGIIRRLYIDGSYVTSKPAPNDVDVTIVFSDDYDLDAEAWRIESSNKSKGKIDLHLFKENDIGLERHLNAWKTYRDKNVPKGIIVLELGQ